DAAPSETEYKGWLRRKARYFAFNKRFDSAFSYQLLYDTFSDSIETRDKNFASRDIGKEYENVELKNLNEDLQKEGKLKNFYLLISAIIIIMAATIASLIWYNLKRTKLLNMRVQEKNNEVEEAFASLEQSHTENTRLMRIVAHDLQSPIAAIRNIMFSLLKKEHLEAQHATFVRIHESCEDAIVLIKNLLNSQPEKQESILEPVNISTLLENCVYLLQSKADEKNQQLEMHVEEAQAWVNRQKIWRVFSNLINNAIKFSYPGTVINITLEKKGPKILISIRDHGIGIPEDLKDKIFNVSEKATRHGTAGEQSYGLGLSICEKIIAEHKGKLWFESTEGEGSVFYVELSSGNDPAL
ncbi:MAG: HAMP domain-containing histidine kinase, partial [Bacteroidetes bacterium]|nr:HAMP domain-containing histidine kinase [Bacteroidota bacterium]